MCTLASRRAGHAVKHVIVWLRSLSCPARARPAAGVGGNVKLRDVDLVNRDTYVKGVPHEMFEVLRREAPVFWHDEEHGRGFCAVTRYEDVVALTNDIVDKVSERGTCDFVVDIAAELPLQVIAEIMGVPMEDRHKVFDWSNRMIGAEDPEYSVTPEAAMEASMELYAYANALAAE